MGFRGGGFDAVSERCNAQLNSKVYHIIFVLLLWSKIFASGCCVFSSKREVVRDTVVCKARLLCFKGVLFV